MQKSYLAKKDQLQKKWYLVDAQEQILGRMAVQIATILMGKHNPWYTPHVDTGDFVVVTNVEKLRVTGNKLDQKQYYRFSGYPGGLRVRNLGEMMESKPQDVLRLAVRRMLPKNRLGRQMLKKLKIYVGDQHPHEAQCPEVWSNDKKVTLKEIS